ncbi:MAG TPA: Hpt domain-containing protein [Thermoanaerobaculia bacterium]|nr:Hpt domain-containing protein [Thermoanaerobaculia bacterium]
MDELLNELRARFRETTASRLDEMRALVATLQIHRDDADALDRLSRHFHGMAGLGATYGYPAISELGDAGEATSIPLVRRAATPSDANVASWLALIEQMTDALRE